MYSFIVCCEFVFIGFKLGRYWVGVIDLMIELGYRIVSLVCIGVLVDVV